MRMVRIYFLQQWFNLSDPAVEEALYDSVAMRCFCRLKDARRIATRYDKCANNFLSAVCLVALIYFWLN
jgi:IS5 family transposase